MALDLSKLWNLARDYSECLGGLVISNLIASFEIRPKSPIGVSLCGVLIVTWFLRNPFILLGICCGASFSFITRTLKQPKSALKQFGCECSDKSQIINTTVVPMV